LKRARGDAGNEEEAAINAKAGRKQDEGMQVVEGGVMDDEEEEEEIEER